MPDDASAYYNGGMGIFSTLKDYEKSIADYTKAIELNADYAKAYYNRGNSFADLKDVRKSHCRLYQSH